MSTETKIISGADAASIIDRLSEEFAALATQRDEEIAVLAGGIDALFAGKTRVVVCAATLTMLREVIKQSNPSTRAVLAAHIIGILVKDVGMTIPGGYGLDLSSAKEEEPEAQSAG